jgi:hypothetical protein
VHNSMWMLYMPNWPKNQYMLLPTKPVFHVYLFYYLQQLICPVILNLQCRYHWQIRMSGECYHSRQDFKTL